MTISSSTSKAQYAGNGSTTVFAFGFKIFAASDLAVIVRSSTGTELTKSLTSDYTVSGVGSASGGNVTMGSAPASGETLTILRVQPLTQGLDLVANDPFPASSLEDQLDKITLMIQNHEEALARTIKASKTNTITSTEFTVSATDRASKIFAFDANGDLSVTQELGTFRGNFAASTAYAVRDIIKDTSTGNIFIVNSAHTSSGSQPLTSNANSAKYDLLVDAASATTSASTASTQATNAANSATAAASSATNAASSATAAASSATNASTFASSSSTGATNASSSATAAASSATAAANSATAAASSATSAANSLASFTGVYSTGSSDPTSNLDEGDLHYNTTSNTLKIYNGSAWVATAGAGGGESNQNAFSNVAVGGQTTVAADTTTDTLTLAAGANVTLTTNAGTDTVTIASTDTNTTYIVGDAGLTQNNFTNTLKTKLDNIESSATADQTASEIRTLVATASDSNVLTDTLKTKLDGIASSATANPNALDNLSEDSSPQLGGNLDVNGNDIVSTSNGAIDLDPNGSGKVTFKGNSTRGAGQFVLNCEQNSHGITVKGPPHSANASYTLTLPNDDGSSGQSLISDGSGNLSWSTISGGSLSGNLAGDIASASYDIVMADNDKIKFGAGTDGELYSDGTNTVLESSTTYVRNTDAGQFGPILYLDHATSSPATTDYNAILQATTTDLGGNTIAPLYISAHTPDVTSGAATGQVKFWTKDDNVSYNTEYFRIDGDAENVGVFKPIKLYEDPNNGSHGVTLQAASSVSSDVTFTLPSADGSSGQALVTNASGTLSFASVNNYVHPNHSGEVTSTADGAQVVADNVIDEANLKVSNSPTNGYVLTAQSGNTGGLTWAAASGGGGGDPDLYRDNASSATTPNASGANAVAIGSGSAASGSGAVALGAATASGSNAVALGRAGAAGDDAISAIVTSNSTSYGGTGVNGIGIGRYNKAPSYAQVIGYNSQQISGNSGSIFGYQNQVSASYGHCFGTSNIVSVQHGTAIGAFAESASKGKIAFSNQRIGYTGDSQAGLTVLRGTTTDANATFLDAGSGSATAADQVILQNESAMTFTGTVVCRQDASDGDEYAGWRIEGVIMRQGQASDTTLGAGTVTSLYQSSGLGAAAVTLAADTSAGGLKVGVQGVGSLDLRWVASLHSSEVEHP